MKRASVLFPENLRCNLTYYESENFSDSFLHHSFESGSEMGKSKLQKIVGRLLDELKKLYLNRTVV